MVAQKKRNRHMLISFFVLLQYNNTTILYYILLACCLSQVCFQDMAALSCMQFANGFLLDLAHAFTG